MASPARQRSLVIPREHGAWGILLIPLVTGSCVGLLAGGSGVMLGPLIVAALGLFWLRTPIESWSGTAPVRARSPREFQLVRNTAFLLAAVSCGALIWLFWGGRNRGLLWIGAAAGVAFLVQAMLRRAWRGARTAAQMIGSAGLTSTAPAAYYAVTGHLNGTAWFLWAANLVFACNQIQFVQLQIHSTHAKARREKLDGGRGFLAGQVVVSTFLIGACAFHLIHWIAALAFLPILYRGFAWFVSKPRPLAIHSLGKSELAYGCFFGLLLIFGTGLS